MKYIRRRIWALVPALTLAALSACEREVDSGRDGLKGDEPEALIPGDGTGRAIIVAPTETRTDFDSYTGNFAWSTGDEIAIHLSDGSYYATPVNPETGVFTCSTTASKRRNAYAIYPASVRDASNYGNPTLNVILPDTYDISGALSSDLSPVPMIAVNQEDQSDLYFRHVGGLIRLTCDGVPAATQKMIVTLDRNMAGKFAVSDADTNHPTISDGGNTRTVTFTVAAAGLGEAADGIVLNLPVPVGTYSGVQFVALNPSDEELFSEARNLSVTIDRGYGKKYLCTLTGDAPDWIILDGEVSLGTLDNGGELSE